MAPDVLGEVMNTQDVHRRVVSSSARISPDEVVNREFPSAFRGIAETEVRAWLRRVADEITSLRTREDELAGLVFELEQKLAKPPELNEDLLLASLGEETTRVLRAAQEAAEDIRSKAEERSTRIVREAQEDAHRIREEAEQILATRTADADSTATELLREAEDTSSRVRVDAEAYGEELREKVTSEAREKVDAARAAAREVLQEAQEFRKGVIADVGKRRGLVLAQVEELRIGRDRLLDAYRIVKRTLDEATEALSQVESRASSELATPPPAPHWDDDAINNAIRAIEQSGPEDVAAMVGAKPLVEPVAEEAPAEPATEEVPESAEMIDPTVVVDLTEPDVSMEDGLVDDEVDEADQVAVIDDEPAVVEGDETVETVEGQVIDEEPAKATAAPSADLDALFARLRGENTSSSLPPSTPKVLVHEGKSGAPSKTRVETKALTSAQDEQLLQRRDETLDPLIGDVVRKAKRRFQDEQNLLLDALRQQRGAVVADQVMPEVGEQLAAFVTFLAPAVQAAHAAGMRSSRAGDQPTSTELVGVARDMTATFARDLVMPLRERVSSAIAEAAELGEDVTALSERINARCREWKVRQVESLTRDALAAVFARGVYDGADSQMPLRWIVDDEQPCPDCDDNALEGTPKGSVFPTGQQYPPAHPGCRCLLAVEG